MTVDFQTIIQEKKLKESINLIKKKKKIVKFSTLSGTIRRERNNKK